MTVVILQLQEIFEILKYNSFVIGIITIDNIVKLIEENSKRKIIHSVGLKSHIEKALRSLKNKWNKLNGGNGRNKFHQFIIGEKITFSVIL